MSIEKDLDLELANDKVDRLKQKIDDAALTVSGLRTETIFAIAEMAAIRSALHTAGLIDAASFARLYADKLQAELEYLVDVGIADASMLEDELEDVAE